MEEHIQIKPEARNRRSQRKQYVKGLLLRIIVACTIFLLLFLGNLLTIEILDYNTDKVVEEIQDNSLIESIEAKFKKTFGKEDRLN